MGSDVERWGNVDVRTGHLTLRFTTHSEDLVPPISRSYVRDVTSTFVGLRDLVVKPFSVSLV